MMKHETWCQSYHRIFYDVFMNFHVHPGISWYFLKLFILFYIILYIFNVLCCFGMFEMLWECLVFLSNVYILLFVSFCFLSFTSQDVWRELPCHAQDWPPKSSTSSTLCFFTDFRCLLMSFVVFKICMCLIVWLPAPVFDIVWYYLIISLSHELLLPRLPQETWASCVMVAGQLWMPWVLPGLAMQSFWWMKRCGVQTGIWW